MSLKMFANSIILFTDSFIEQILTVYTGQVTREKKVRLSRRIFVTLVVFAKGWEEARGCRIEHECALQYGYRIIDDLKAGLNLYLTEKGFASVDEARGLALESVSETTDVLERDTIIFPKFDREKCIGCGRCMISCADGGHQAIRLSEERRPILDGKKCVGCHLCVLVCPERAICSSRKRITKMA
jgi:ferredoxin